MKSPEQNFEKSISSPKEYYLGRLKWFRNDFIDDLPEDKVIPHETPNWDKYKCRGNFFQGVVGDLDNILTEGIIKDEKIISDIEAFLKYATEEIDFSKFTTKENIQRADEILDEVIKHFS